MESLIFALNAVAPIVLAVVVGYVLKSIGMMDEKFSKMANKLVFRVFMPVMLFVNIYKISDLSEIDLGFIGFSMIALAVIFAVALPACIIMTKKNDRRGVLLQAIFRSGYSLIGIPLAKELCSAGGEMSATILSCVLIPGFNVLAVVSLSVFGGKEGEKISVWKIIKDIITNPLIVGIFSAIACVAVRMAFQNFGIEFRLSDIKPLFAVLEYLKALAIPLALLVLGAQFEFSAVAALKKEIIFGTLTRTVIVPAVVLGIAYAFFRERFAAAQFATLIAAFATPVAVPSVPMVQEVGGDVTLAGQLVVWSTLVSAVTVFLVTFLLRMGGALG